MNENKVVEMEVAEVEEMEVTKESKMKGFVTKAKEVVKKHGKKVAVGVAIVAGGFIAYKLGKNSGNLDLEELDLTNMELIDDVVNENADLVEL